MLSKDFKAGTYYVGDPGYVVEHEKWLNLLGETNFFENEEQNYNGYPMLAGGTAIGDGLYYDNCSRNYPVDAGLIGIIPMEAIIDKSAAENLGNIVTFKNDFSAEIEDGIFTFGSIVINTKPKPRCEWCGDSFDEDELTEGKCPNCYEEYINENKEDEDE